MQTLYKHIEIDNLTNHLHVVAKELNCQLNLSFNLPGMMYVEHGRVEGPSLHSPQFTPDSAYMTNLHELGHFALNHTQGRPPNQNQIFYFTNGVLKSEAQAWEWALNQSIIKKFSDVAKHHMATKCLGSYILAAKSAKGKTQRLYNGNRHHVEFTYDHITPFVLKIQQQLAS